MNDNSQIAAEQRTKQQFILLENRKVGFHIKN